MKQHPPHLVATIDQHVITRGDGTRVMRPWRVETSYAVLSGDFDFVQWNKMSEAAQKVYVLLLGRIHIAEVKIAKLDAHVRAWAEQNITTTGQFEDMPGCLQRAIRIAEAMEDARLLGREIAERDHASTGIPIGASAEVDVPHKRLGLEWITTHIGIPVGDALWKSIGRNWIASFDQAYKDRCNEILFERNNKAG